MSYIKNVKKLLSDDLKGLISHFTGFEEGSPEFRKCEDSAWSIIVDRYYPSVDEHNVKLTLQEFVYKFKVHGFPQKAENLSKLIKVYSQLPYFKKYSNTDVQWGLIDLLTKLSFKPTNALADDPPLDLDKKGASDEEAFDWGAYLKEGLEKFKLPSEDGDSLSDWSDSEGSEINDGKERSLIKEVPRVELPLKRVVRPSQLDLRLEELKREEETASFLEKLKEGMWWMNTSLREIPISANPEANYCFVWEKINNKVNETRILSEYKVLRELIYILALPSECYFVQKASDGSFSIVPNTSIASLSPDMFKIVIEENFCKYLPHIEKLLAFYSEINEAEPLSYVPATYRAYGVRIKKFYRKYTDKLLEIEKRVDAQESITTIRYLLKEIAPFLNHLEFFSRLHDEAVPDDWRDKDHRSNAFTLLNVLYNELKQPKQRVYVDPGWLARSLLVLFVDSLCPFLCELAQHMAGQPYKPSEQEFFLSMSGEIVVDYRGLSSQDFWEAVLKTASSAIGSTLFLLQLDRYPYFFKNGHDRRILFEKTVEKLVEMLLYERLDLDSENKIEEASENLEDPNHILRGVLDGSHWDCLWNKMMAPPPKLFHKSGSDRLDEILSDTDLSSHTLHTVIRNAVKSVIEEYMEPKGFAAEIFLDQLKLLDHLRALFLSVQVTSVLSSCLIAQSTKRWRKIMIDFEECLSDILPHQYVQNFRINIDSTSLQKNVNLIDLTDHMNLNYKADPIIMTVIPNETILGYAKLFRFLLKTRMALASINRLVFKRIEGETDEKYGRINRLCSLRFWLIHTMNILNLYFSTYSDSEFQRKMKNLCLSARKLTSIYEAHIDFVEKWKSHCFLTDGHPCYENISKLISLCLRMNVFWKMEAKDQLADYHMDGIEKDYIDCVRDFTSNLQLYEDRLTDSNDVFSYLFDELSNNFPTTD